MPVPPSSVAAAVFTAPISAGRAVSTVQHTHQVPEFICPESMSTTDGRWLLFVAQSFGGFGTGTRGGDRGRCGALCGRHCSASIDPTMLAASFAMPPGWLGSECSGVRRAGTDQAPAASSRRSAHLVRSAAQDAIPLPATAWLGARGCTARTGRRDSAAEATPSNRGASRAGTGEQEEERERQTERDRQRERERERQTDRQTDRQTKGDVPEGRDMHVPAVGCCVHLPLPALPVVSCVRPFACSAPAARSRLGRQVGGGAGDVAWQSPLRWGRLLSLSLL